jgi:uncharacterized membrane protein YeaQ/YmgE (transglycosylase-associated protein family)
MEDQTQALLSMPGVGFLGMLIIGILAGWIAEKITASDHGLLTNLLVGIAGSFIGGTLANLMNQSDLRHDLTQSVRYSSYPLSTSSDGAVICRRGEKSLGVVHAFQVLIVQRAAVSPPWSCPPVSGKGRCGDR